jgi:hypothetical protein
VGLEVPRLWHAFLAVRVAKVLPELRRTVRVKGEERMGQESKDPQPQALMGAGIGAGIAIGAGLGVALDNIPIGIAIGLAIGAGLGGAFSQSGGQGQPLSASQRRYLLVTVVMGLLLLVIAVVFLLVIR